MISSLSILFLDSLKLANVYITFFYAVLFSSYIRSCVHSLIDYGRGAIVAAILLPCKKTLRLLVTLIPLFHLYRSTPSSGFLFIFLCRLYPLFLFVTDCPFAYWLFELVFPHNVKPPIRLSSSIVSSSLYVFYVFSTDVSFFILYSPLLNPYVCFTSLTCLLPQSPTNPITDMWNRFFADLGSPRLFCPAILYVCLSSSPSSGLLPLLQIRCMHSSRHPFSFPEI